MLRCSSPETPVVVTVEVPCEATERPVPDTVKGPRDAVWKRKQMCAEREWGLTSCLTCRGTC